MKYIYEYPDTRNIYGYLDTRKIYGYQDAGNIFRAENFRMVDTEIKA